jgi:hypothetical protein
MYCLIINTARIRVINHFIFTIPDKSGRRFAFKTREFIELSFMKSKFITTFI